MTMPEHGYLLIVVLLQTRVVKVRRRKVQMTSDLIRSGRRIS